jgi:hypothetical protein
MTTRGPRGGIGNAGRGPAAGIGAGLTIGLLVLPAIPVLGFLV